MRLFAFCFLFSLFYYSALSQQAGPSKLKVFLDCSQARCDRTFLVSEIRIIDFVRDRLAADVHLLITSQRSGSGGQQYQLLFYGQNEFTGPVDTLHFSTSPIATDAEQRELMAHFIKRGLLPFVNKTAYSGAYTIDMKGAGAEGALATTPSHDKWNYWVFRVGSSGEISGERVYKANRFNFDLSASRTTDKLKVEFYTYGSKRHTKYEYISETDTTIDVVNNSEWGVFHNMVRSFNSHWSYGYQTSLSGNTYSNLKQRIYFNPAIEYNFYPYSEVNNRFFVLRYGLDAVGNKYYDTTIYNHIQEMLYGHRFSAAFTLNQKWGTFNSGLYYRNYFHDWRMRSMGININLKVRITGGLSFEIYSSGSIIHDQVYLKKGNASERDVLTRRHQLASSFSYRTSFGLNYRFGSILNNVINPRFEGYGGF